MDVHSVPGWFASLLRGRIILRRKRLLARLILVEPRLHSFPLAFLHHLSGPVVGGLVCTAPGTQSLPKGHHVVGMDGSVVPRKNAAWPNISCASLRASSALGLTIRFRPLRRDVQPLDESAKCSSSSLTTIQPHWELEQLAKASVGKPPFQAPAAPDLILDIPVESQDECFGDWAPIEKKTVSFRLQTPHEGVETASSSKYLLPGIRWMNQAGRISCLDCPVGLGWG